MKRRRQCPARPKWYIGDRWQCQRLAEHDGPHQASYSKKSRAHLSWRDGDDRFDYETLPGTVRYRLPFWTADRIVRSIEWAAYAVITFTLWRCWSLSAAAGFLVAELLLSVRRSHFLDFGRFILGVWRVPPTAPAPILGIGWVLHGKDRAGPKAGLDLVIGRVAMGAFTLMPRKEWAEYKRNKAERRAREAGATS
ncbi:hypothetical protein IM697_18445 [Streptomyces ferrugineus]|uniref:Uncharacterized protein n=1 Tax=Streptomyces ferrugineus TaxID=1413221 RepID=A0A7M2SVB3_9ACTN|nr:hypothetical protein [Streptomyces ferrugineus]QOV40202.1 hypothetical protein IM697_18445 [Streptomyces ferrugineus]